ncbi:hypothetical protein G6F68_017870 [Rhizopus microsporus]|nr:hypothetical protein G6F68_017870 [Rhizopus microsporus]
MVDTSSIVMLCPYYSEPVSLMAAMGKMKQTVAFMGISDDVSASENIGFSRSGNETVMRDLHFSADLQDSEDIYDKWVAKINKTHKSESKALAELLKNGVSEEKFTETFFEYVNPRQNNTANG